MSNITHYELTAIIDSNIPDDKHLGIIERMKELISKNQGKVSSENNLGRKKLSYPIEKSLKGVFICLEFDIEPKTLKSIEKELKLNKNVIRYLIIKKPGNVKPITSESSNKEEKVIKKDKDQAELGKEKKVEQKVETPIDNVEKSKEEKVGRDDKKTSLNELDKKLDEILNDDIIN